MMDSQPAQVAMENPMELCSAVTTYNYWCSIPGGDVSMKPGCNCSCVLVPNHIEHYGQGRTTLLTPFSISKQSDNFPSTAAYADSPVCSHCKAATILLGTCCCGRSWIAPVALDLVVAVLGALVAPLYELIEPLFQDLVGMACCVSHAKAWLYVALAVVFIPELSTYLTFNCLSKPLHTLHKRSTWMCKGCKENHTSTHMQTQRDN